MKARPRITPLLLGALMLQAPAFAQQYHSNDITPAGSGSGKLTGSSSGRQVGGAQPSGSYSPHAYLLTGNAVTAVDLNPVGAYQSFATCVDDSQQGGWASLPTGLHAVVWSGSSSSCVDLNPSGYNFSYCLGVHNGEQVGYAQQQSYFVTASHAYSWHGSAASGVDLHTGPYPFSRALACRDGEEVGYISTIAYPEGEYLSYRTGSHAMRWAGTAASGVDLHPAGYDSSEAVATNGTQQGGWGYSALSATRVRALLWSGTPESVVDLHPAGYTESRINAMNATQQVGDGWVGAPGAIGSVRHALAWSGTADSVVDLNPYLPTGYTHGVATGVDADGNIVGYAYNTFQAGVSIPQNAISVVFAPGVAPATQIASFSLSSTNVAPGDTVDGTVTLGGAAPVGGTTITFLSTNTALVATPASLVIAEGETSATFPVTTGGQSLMTPATVKVYGTDGAVSRYASVTITPVVKIASVGGNPVEGGFSTTGYVTLSIPAQAGGVVVSLTSADSSLVAVPATVTIPQGYQSWSFTINTGAVSATTPVGITASYKNVTVSGTVSLSAAPVISIATLSVTEVVGGKPASGTISLNNFSRNFAGTVVTLTSGDTATVQVPATVTIPYGTYSASFTMTTSVVAGIQTIPVKATYDGASLTSSLIVNPVPTVTIVSADWDPTTLLFKVQADTSYANSILTFGTDAASGPIGTMQFEQNTWKGSILMPTAPTTATVWNSNGGQASMPVRIKGVKSGGGSTSTGGTASSYKIAVKSTGKGSVSMSPSGPTFAVGTVVTLTATPDAGAPWVGWSGGVVSKEKTITVTVKSDLTLTANFK